MWAKERRSLGKAGEEVAIGFLKTQHYKIVERNYRTPFGEIDVIAKDADSLVFVEIKTRASSSIGPPFLSVTRNKKRKVVQNALFYLARNDLRDSDWRIDVVSVSMCGHHNIESIEVIKDAICEEDI